MARLSPRCRARINGALAGNIYDTLVEAWIQEGPLGCLKTRFGGKLVRDFRSVSPTMLVASSTLMRSFIVAGCDQAVIQIPKFEASLRKQLAANPCLAGSVNPDVLVLEIGSHLQHCFTMLRNLHYEEQNEDPLRRNPKTGGIRKFLSASDWAVLQPTKALLQTTSGPISSSELVLPPAESARTPSPRGSSAEVACDEDCFPFVFLQPFRYLKNYHK